MRRLIEFAHTEAWSILSEYRDTLDVLATNLLEKETLTPGTWSRSSPVSSKRPRITAFNDWGDRTPSDKPPVKTPGELAIERGEPWPPKQPVVPSPFPPASTSPLPGTPSPYPTGPQPGYPQPGYGPGPHRRAAPTPTTAPYATGRPWLVAPKRFPKTVHPKTVHPKTVHPKTVHPKTVHPRTVPRSRPVPGWAGRAAKRLATVTAPTVPATSSSASCTRVTGTLRDAVGSASSRDALRDQDVWSAKSLLIPGAEATRG